MSECVRMSEAFSLAFGTAFSESAFCSSRRMSDSLGVARSFSLVITPIFLSRTFSISMPQTERPVITLKGFVDDRPYILRNDPLT